MTPFVTSQRAKEWSGGVCTCEVEGEGDEAVVFAEDAQRLLPLHQREEVIRHRLAVEEVVDAQQEVPARSANIKRKKKSTLGLNSSSSCSCSPGGLTHGARKSAMPSAATINNKYLFCFYVMLSVFIFLFY